MNQVFVTWVFCPGSIKKQSMKIYTICIPCILKYVKVHLYFSIVMLLYIVWQQYILKFLCKQNYMSWWCVFLQNCSVTILKMCLMIWLRFTWEMTFMINLINTQIHWHKLTITEQTLLILYYSYLHHCTELSFSFFPSFDIFIHGVMYRHFWGLLLKPTYKDSQLNTL